MLRAQELLKIQEERPDRNEAFIRKQKEILKKSKRSAFIRNCFSRFVPEKLRAKRRNQIKEKGGWKRKKEFFEELTRLQQPHQHTSPIDAASSSKQNDC